MTASGKPGAFCARIRRRLNSTGEGRIVDFDVTLIVHDESGRADEMITAEVSPDLIRGSRRIRDVENNIYQPATAAKWR